jgi:hypothetical protein
MKMLFLPILSVCVLSLTSCALVRAVTQVPFRALQSVTRAVGVGIEQSEVEAKTQGPAKDGVKVEFERVPLAR